MELVVKRCSTCRKFKDIDEFSRSRTYKDGYAYVCKQCNNAYQRKKNFERKPYNPKDIFDRVRVTKGLVSDTMEMLELMGYNTSEDVHLQFCLKYNLPYKEKPKENDLTKFR